MIKAIRSFDLERGTSFSTYAVPLVFGEIRRYMRDEGPIKIGRYYKKLGASLMNARNTILAEEGREAHIDELAKILDDSEEIVEMYLIDKTILFKFKNISFLTRLVEGNYPDTSSLFPKEQLLSVKFKKADLISAVDRASLFTNSDNLSVVKFNISASKTVEISSNSTEIGKVVEEVEALEISSNLPFQTAFSTKYLSDALKSLDDSVIVINFTGEIKPAVIKGEKTPELTQLLLPVRVF